MDYPALQRAEIEIEEGKLGIARDRLHGLVLSYPADLSLRSRLGDVYMMLGYPREAGRWWFLDENLTEEKQAAVDLFVNECQRDPSRILERLKLRCRPEELASTISRERIQAQIDECRGRGVEPPAPKHAPQRAHWAATPLACAFSLLLVLAAFFALALFIALATWAGQTIYRWMGGG